MVAIPTVVALRPVSSAARVGEHSAVVWNCDSRIPRSALRLIAGMSTRPPQQSLVALPMSFLMAFAAGLSWFNGVVMTVYPALWQVGRIAADEPPGRRTETFLRVGGLTPQSGPEAALLTVMGVVLLLAAPWITRGLVLCDRWLITALLGPTRAQRRFRDL